MSEKQATKTTAKPTEANKIKNAQVAGDFIPKENERDLFHVRMDKKAFSQKTGEKISKDYVQTYTSKEWNAFKKNGQGLGFTTTVLWNPEEYK